MTEEQQLKNASLMAAARAIAEVLCKGVADAGPAAAAAAAARGTGVEAELRCAVECYDASRVYNLLGEVECLPTVDRSSAFAVVAARVARRLWSTGRTE